MSEYMLASRTLRVNVEAEWLAKAIYMSYSVAYRVPAQPWSDLPVSLRCGLIELSGRVLLSIAPSQAVPTLMDLHESVYRFANDLGKALAPQHAARVLHLQEK